MNKIIYIFSSMMLLLFLVGCDMNKTTTSMTSNTISLTSTQSTTTASTTISTTTQSTTQPSTTASTTLLTTQSTTVETTIVSTTTTQNEPFIPTNYSLLQDELETVGIPSTGDVKVLVFAVDFSDYPSFGSGVTISDINTAFNGSSFLTSYESLNSYYNKSSYSQLNLTADIFGFYRASNPSTYYEDEYEKLWAWNDVTNDYLYGEDEVTYPDSDIIFEVLSYYDDQIDYSDYDANQDGYIDGIYIVYTAPVSYSYGSDLWWAYQDYYAYYDEAFDQVYPNYFCWSGTDFLLEGDSGINARTIIHETGHMLGLDDYYDYETSDNYNRGGLGGADMMDNTVGDHNPFSKLLLGWVKPYVVTESMTVDLTPFIGSGETLLIINEWNNTIFDEYLLVSFFTPTGLNFLDRYELFSISGIIIYHVDARIGNPDPNSSYPYSIFTYNNTDSIHKMIDIIEADQDNDIALNSSAENTDLFQMGHIFKENTHYFYDWYQTNIDMNFTIEVKSKDTSKVTIIIDFE